jgi:O-antigen/teichoic acid export membrane protein
VEPLQILLLLLPLAFVRNVSQGALLAHGRQDQMLRTVAWAAATNVGLNLLLIPRWGLAGAAWATVATEGVRTVLAALYALRLGLPMTDPRRFWRIVLATSAMTAAVLGVGAMSLVPAIVVGALSYLAVLALAGGIRFGRGRMPELTV